MGIYFSSLRAEINNAKIESKIHKEEKERKVKVKEIKLLLLGPGESGKSTVLRQFRLIYGQEWSVFERKQFRPAILNNVISSAKTLVSAMDTLSIPWGSEEAKNASKTVLLSPNLWGEGEIVPQEIVNATQLIWRDTGIQACFARSNEFQLIDSCKYFMDEIPRVCRADYLPTNDDILHSRIMTTTISENKFQIGDRTFRIIDVGGQRSQRKNWAPFFDDSDAIIFVVAISAYDQTCFEDEKTNRMVESLSLFASICNHPLFINTTIILFFNKIDLITEKLKVSPIGKFFPDYTGADDFKSAATFFAGKFRKENQNPKKDIYISFTWATDTKQIETVIKTVYDTIIKMGLTHMGLL